MAFEIKVKFGVGEGKICFLLLIFNYLFIHLCSYIWQCIVSKMDNVPLESLWFQWNYCCGFNYFIVDISLKECTFHLVFVSFQSPVMLTYLRLQVSASFSDVAAAWDPMWGGWCVWGWQGRQLQQDNCGQSVLAVNQEQGSSQGAREEYSLFIQIKRGSAIYNCHDSG